MSVVNLRCLPIDTIFPPATLSVENAYTIPSLMLQVPQFDFSTSSFVTGLPEGTNTPWGGPSQPVQNIASAVMGLGQILSITPPVPNITWTDDFWGPALQCSDVPEAEREKSG